MNWYCVSHIDQYNIITIGQGQTRSIAINNFNAVSVNKNIPETELIWKTTQLN